MPTQEAVRRMLTLWTVDQYANVLSLLGSQYPDVLAHISAENDKDPKLKKVFVRNLSFDTGDEALRNAFAGFGAISEAVVIINKATGRSKGFGFVTFETAEDASKAIANSSIDIDGRTAYCNLAAQRDAGRGGSSRNDQQGPGGFGGGPSPGGFLPGASGVPPPGDTSQTKLFVRSLDFKTTSDGLRQAFSVFGAIKEAVVLEDKGTGQSKGYGFVTFETIDSAKAALVEPNKVIDGRVTISKLADAPNENRRSRGGGGGGYGGPPPRSNFGGPAYGHAPPMGGYQPAGPPPQSSWAPPPSPYGAQYSAPPVSGYQPPAQYAPPAAGAYGAPVATPGYGAPAATPGYGAPAATQGYGAAAGAPGGAPPAGQWGQ